MTPMETGGLTLRLTKTTRSNNTNNMAYRRTRQSGQKRKSNKISKQISKTTPLRIPVVDNKVDNQIKQLNVQVPSSSSSLNLDDCCLMAWGSGVTSPGMYSGLGGLPVGPDIQLNVAPPLPGSPFDDISPIEFLNFWGVQAPNGSYPLGASGNINISYSVRIWTGSINNLPIFSLMSLTPGMYMHSIRLTGKARLVKASGQQIPLHFEHKNSIPFLAYTNMNISTNFGGSVDYPIFQESSSGGEEKYIEFYVNDTDVPLDKCFWKPVNLNNHAPGQSPGFVLPNPTWPYPYGIDANFGLDMNNSFPITNFFGYGDKLIIENITAFANPYWGLKNCSFALDADTDGDGQADSFFGNIVEITGQGPAPVSGGTAGANLQTMLPSETKILNFTN